MSIISLFINIIIPITIVIAIIIVLLKVLIDMNKKIKQNIEKEKEEKKFFITQIQKLKSSSSKPNEKLKILNKIIRDFFKKEFELDYNLTYLELAKKFEDKKEIKLANFCKKIVELEYARTDITNKEIDILINFFEKLVEIVIKKTKHESN